MGLSAGERVGAYEIVGVLGYGAMGEVYRARDTRLGRDVAVKVLPAAFANDPDRLSRVEREARIVSQLNHPNVCTLFDIVEGGHAPILILELVEGETLQQRLLRGPMPLGEVLRCASGIAAALSAAHTKGIIHRDLKPSNIKIISPGVSKVLDFGVAKLARDSSEALGEPDLTLTLGGTKEGVLVGTVAYVSPEQAMGERVDGRTDIWAFGCVLYEMLTARRAFPGVAVADTLGAVMRGEPDWTMLPPHTPQALRTLLRRCLEKDRGRRLADIADARLEIDDLLAGRLAQAPDSAAQAKIGVAPPQPRGARSLIALAFLAGVLFASVVAYVTLNRYAQQPPAPGSATSVSSAPQSRGTPSTTSTIPAGPPSSLAATPTAAGTPGNGGTNLARNSARGAAAEPSSIAIELPDGLRWARAVDDGVPNTLLALSPDGRLLIFSARADDVPSLWLRSLTSNETWQLPATEGAVSPFWSPDSTAIGFFADRKLKRLDLNGLGTRSRDPRALGMPVTLTDVRSQRGGTWGADNTIVFAPFPGVLKRIPANGGAVTNLTELERGEPYHVRAQFFPGTRSLLYRVNSGNGRNNPYYAMSLNGYDRKLIGRFDSGNVIYSMGHLLFMQSHTLMAQPFDVQTFTVTRPARPVATNVLLSTGSPPVFGVFSASQTDRLVYLSQGGEFNDPMTLLSNWAQVPASRQ